MSAGYLLLCLFVYLFYLGDTLKMVIFLCGCFMLAVIASPINDAKVVIDEYEEEPIHVEPSKTEEPEIAGDLGLIATADAIAVRHKIDPALFRALITQESAWNPDAVSHAGAAGLTQLMPATAREHCGLEQDEIFKVEKNLKCGASYLKAQLIRFGDVRLALAAYNSGPNRVARLGRVPNIPETKDYVRRIMKMWENTNTGDSI